MQEDDQFLFRELDRITMLKTLPSMDREIACARWHFALEQMYKINGDSEF